MKFSFSPRPGVTFPNFWFFLNECSDNNHYFWTKVTWHHICVLLQLNFLLFLRKILEMWPCKIPFWKQEKLLHAQMIGSLGTIWFSSICLFPYDFQWHRVGYLRLKPHDHSSGKSTYIITCCKTLIRATFQSIRKTRIWWSQGFFLPNLTTRWLVCKQSPNIG